MGEYKKISFSEAQRLANQGDTEAMRRLAMAYIQGDGVSKDLEKAFEWILEAAELGNIEAQAEWAEICRNTERFDASFYWEKKAAEQGKPASQNNLAILYDRGMGTSKNEEQAFYWFKKAAENGYTDAKHSLAVCYITGAGTPQDTDKGIFWLEQASNDGHAVAKEKLGTIYAEGWHGVKDEKKGISLLREAASLGSETANNILDRLSSGSSLSNNPSYAGDSSTSKKSIYNEEFNKLKKQLLTIKIFTFAGGIIGFFTAFSGRNMSLGDQIGVAILSTVIGLLLGLSISSLWTLLKWAGKKADSIVSIFTDDNSLANLIVAFFIFGCTYPALPIISIYRYFSIRKKIKEQQQ